MAVSISAFFVLLSCAGIVTCDLPEIISLFFLRVDFFLLLCDAVALLQGCFFYLFFVLFCFLFDFRSPSKHAQACVFGLVTTGWVAATAQM